MCNKHISQEFWPGATATHRHTHHATRNIFVSMPTDNTPISSSTYFVPEESVVHGCSSSKPLGHLCVGSNDQVGHKLCHGRDPSEDCNVYHWALARARCHWNPEFLANALLGGDVMTERLHLLLCIITLSFPLCFCFFINNLAVKFFDKLVKEWETGHRNKTDLKLIIFWQLILNFYLFLGLVKRSEENLNQYLNYQS